MTAATSCAPAAPFEAAPAAPEPVQVPELVQAARLRIQKEQRHIAARRAYFGCSKDRDVPVSERERLFGELRFAADEVRRARADFDDVISHAIRGGLA